MERKERTLAVEFGWFLLQVGHSPTGICTVARVQSPSKSYVSHYSKFGRLSEPTMGR